MSLFLTHWYIMMLCMCASGVISSFCNIISPRWPPRQWRSLLTRCKVSFPGLGNVSELISLSNRCFAEPLQNKKAPERSPSRVLKRRDHFGDLCSASIRISINHSVWLSVIIRHKIKTRKVIRHRQTVTQKFGATLEKSFQFFVRKPPSYVYFRVVFFRLLIFSQ